MSADFTTSIQKSGRIITMAIRYRLALFALMMLTSCGATVRRAPETITVEEATAVLLRAEQFAKAGNAAGLCSLTDNQPNCILKLQQAGGVANAPQRTPEIVETFILLTRGNSIGGRVLVLEGRTANGNAFRTDFLVFDRGNDQLTPLVPVYWSGR